jgi:translation initiation factor 4E
MAESKVEVPESKDEPELVMKTSHRLHTPWTLWAKDPQPKTGVKSANVEDFTQNLKTLGKFDTLEGFWRHYSWLKSPDDLAKDSDLFCFRNSLVPAWETFPAGGAWIIKVRKRNGVISRLWEELLFAAIGELFDCPDVMGVSLCVRTRDDNLSVWNRASNPETKILIGEKLKELLHLDESTTLLYQEFKKAIEYGSSFRNAKAYVFAASNYPANEEDAAPAADEAPTTSAPESATTSA